MSTTTTMPRTAGATGVDWVAVARVLGPGFASRAPAHDANDSFPVENYRDLEERRVFSALVPAALGGGGASVAEVCAMLREMGRHCGSTALAVSMHMHLVAGQVWLHRQGAPTAPLLERIAAEQTVLATTAASDWLDSDGESVRVDGGYRVTAHKHFASGSPAADILLTSVLHEHPEEGTQVLHIALPTDADGFRVLDNWRTMGMRATGSNDVVLDGVVVPDQAVGSRRPRGAWTPFLSVVATVALPMICSVYLGIGEAARDLAVAKVQRKREDPNVWCLVGEMENALTTARLAVASQVEQVGDLAFPPDQGMVNRAMIAKTIAGRALIQTVETAVEVVGGGALFRSAGLERLLRDVHAITFHPLHPKRQERFTGRMALGLDPVG